MTNSTLAIQGPRMNFWGRVTNTGKVSLDMVRNPIGYAAQTAAGAALLEMAVHAQTDMNTAITTVSGYWTTIYPIGVAIVVFVVGRKIVKKL